MSVDQILRRVSRGTLKVGAARRQLDHLPYQNLGFARLDGHRLLRRGFPEVIWGKGKTLDQLESICRVYLRRLDPLLITKISPGVFRRLSQRIPSLRYHAQAQMATALPRKPKIKGGLVVVVTGGTSDMPIAEEAKVTLEAMGNRVSALYDVGVAGVHRLLDKLALIRKARVVVVVAGMEGALPSVVSGLVACPVISVPTSVGYGAHFKGLAPLLSMLNSCSPGIGVVNIDNGFGAGFLASLINRG